MQLPENSIYEILKNYKGGAILYEKRKSNIKYIELPTDTFTSVERKYLKSRNFSPKYLHKKYGVVGGGISGKWKFRIIIPVYYNGRLISWTARSILSKKKLKELEIPRYKNLSTDESVKNIKECLFNIDHCKKDVAVLVEGAFDVMRLGDDFLCSMGTELTQGQIKIISDNFRKIFIMFDNEPEVQEKARKIRTILLQWELMLKL